MQASYSGSNRSVKYLFENATEVSVEQVLTSGTPIATVTVDGDDVNLYAPAGGGGTTVVANPAGEPTDDLDTVQIGNVIYNIPGSGGSGGNPGVSVVETTGSSGSKTYTAPKDGIYAIFATVTYQGSCTITLPNDAITLFSNDLTVSSRVSRYLIVELTANSTVTVSMSVSQWLGCCSGLIALKNMKIKNVADSTSVADSNATLTLPNDDKMYLVIGSCAARTISDTRDDTTGGNPNYDEKINTSTLSKLHIGLSKGSDSPTYSLYAYDGGIASVIAYELNPDLVYVEANPEGQATEDLDTILIDDTIYKLKGSGGGQSYVCDVLFDTPTTTSAWASPIEICTEAKAKEYDMLHILSSTYTGEPMAETILVKALGNTSTPFYIVSPRTDVNVNGIQGFIFLAFDSGKLKFYTGTGNSVTLVKVYGLKFASNVVNNNYLSDYYSTDERVVGRWTDGKPIYQKSIPYDFTSSVNDWTLFDDSVSYENLVAAIPIMKAVNSSEDQITLYGDAETSPRWCIKNDHKLYYYLDNARRRGIVTFQYTKTTDAPGSGPTKGNLIYLPALYSEEEREVGVWTDGKPLYQKTFVGNMNLETSTWTEIGSVSDVDELVFIKGTVDYGSGITEEPYIRGRYYSGKVYYYTNQLIPGTGYGNITIQYTKTTDTPGSGRYLPDGQYAHHYSTSEHIVGTWIDGSTIYERTWDLGSDITVSPNSWLDTSIVRGNINRIISYDAMSSEGANRALDVACDSTYIQVLSMRSNNDVVRYLTLQYTKSS